MILVDSLAHLHGDRDIARRTHRTLDDFAEQAELPRESGTAPFAGDLGHRASEIQVDVIGAVFGDEHGHGLGDRLRIDTVQLNAAQLFGLVVLDEAHARRSALDKSAARDHFAHVQTGAELAAEASECGVRDSGHRGEHDGRIEVERTDPQDRRSGGGESHPSILSDGAPVGG